MNFLERLFEHNNWANEQIIQACAALTDEQLDAQPHSATRGSIRETLLHLVKAQQGYLRILALPLEARLTPVSLSFAELEQSASASGEGLLALARDPSSIPAARLQTSDGYRSEPWVLLVQVINHATEHREQIKSMLGALGLTPPEVDGWSYGESVNAVTPPST